MRSRNNTVYTGKVGAPIRKTRPKKTTVKKVRYICKDGPMKGYSLMLADDGATAVMSINGQVGRYNQGKWEVA